MSVNKIYFKLRDDVDSEFKKNISRREICWLVKNQLDNAWGFNRARVEKLNDNKDSKKCKYDFRVLTKKEINLDKIIPRLIFTEKIFNTLDSEEHICDRKYWNSRNTDVFFYEDYGKNDMALFNFIHPYLHGNILNLNRNTKNKLSDVKIDKVTGAIGHINEKDVEDGTLDEYLDKCSKNLLKLRRNKENKAKNDEIRSIKSKLNSDALSPGMVLLRYEYDGHDKSHITSKREIGQPDIKSVVKNFGTDTLIVNKAEKQGLGLHFHEIDYKNNYIYLGFRKQKRCGGTKKIQKNAKSYDSEFEIRKLKITEHLRDNLPGFKGFSQGEIKRLVYETDQGWKIFLYRPGFKDCEDFYVELHSPAGEKSIAFETKDPKPVFTKIFKEAKSYFTHPKANEHFTNALYEIWKADKILEDILDIYIPKILHTNVETEYNPEGFLVMIHYLFIVEDVNYRFFYHGTPKGFQGHIFLRKLGRDDPFNGFLEIKSGNYRLIEEAKNVNKIPRPKKYHNKFKP